MNGLSQRSSRVGVLLVGLATVSMLLTGGVGAAAATPGDVVDDAEDEVGAVEEEAKGETSASGGASGSATTSEEGERGTEHEASAEAGTSASAGADAYENDGGNADANAVGQHLVISVDENGNPTVEHPVGE